MSIQVCGSGAQGSADEALMQSTNGGLQHLPQLNGSGVFGLLSATELIRWQSASARPLAALLRQAQGLQQMIRASARLASLQLRLEAGGATPGQVGRALSSLNDVITCRLIELAQDELGPAPVAFAWLACGSQGRHEQTVHSDQDNALIFDDAYDERRHGSYFEQLAQRVNDGLDACGCHYCPGRVMASNPAWRQPQKVWMATVVGWVSDAGVLAAMLEANFLDLRCVYGDAALLTPVLQAIRLPGGASVGSRSRRIARMRRI